MPVTERTMMVAPCEQRSLLDVCGSVLGVPSGCQISLAATGCRGSGLQFWRLE
jgi:hypothetical protein